MTRTGTGSRVERWRRLSALAASRVAMARQRIAEVQQARALAQGEFDGIAAFCSRWSGAAGPLTSLSLAAADRRRAMLLSAMARLEEAAQQAAREMASARKADEACRARLLEALRAAGERMAELERQEHIARRAVDAISGQASPSIIDIAVCTSGRSAEEA